MSKEARDAVWAHSTQSGSPLVVLLAMAELASKEMLAWPSVPTLARMARITERNVRNAIDKLVEAGEIRKAGTGRRGVVIYDLTPVARDRGQEAEPLSSATGDEDHQPLSPATPVGIDTPVARDTPPLSSATGDPLSPATPKPSYNRKGTVEDEDAGTRKGAVPVRGAVPAATDHGAAQIAAAWPDVAERVLSILGTSSKDPTWYGTTGVVQQWLADGADPERDIYPTITAVIAKARQARQDSAWLPNGLRFFSRAVAETRILNTTMPPGGPNGRPHRHTKLDPDLQLQADRDAILSALADELASG